MRYYRTYELPWSADDVQERKFRRLLTAIILGSLMLGLVWPFIPVPELDPNDIDEIPPRIAKLILEQRLPPPPPPKAKPPEPERVTEAMPEKVVERTPPPPVDKTKIARDKAQAALMPFAEDLADLRDIDLIARVSDQRTLTASVGQSQRTNRSIITSKVGASSSGINTSDMSRNTGGTGLGGRTTTQVSSSVAGIGRAGGGARRTGTSGKASRSREEIELVFDRNKGAIFALYNRALRRDPTLEGKLVLRLTIAPTGEVTFCEVVSSELGDSELERKLVQRIKLFRFESRDVETITTTKPIDFFPA
ncbi:MAG: AgmX/PglI C-terminal domain-containing protein [Woeseiaceae bacterium]